MKQIKITSFPKIGEGWQYSTYDIGNGRVYKKFHSKPRAYWNIIKTTFPFNKNPIWRIPSYARSSRLQALESFNFLEKSEINRSLFGNFIRKNHLDFEQDKVITIKDHLKIISTEDGEKIIDDFIKLNKHFIQKGFIEKSFNIGQNFGVNSNRDIVLIDIGELWSDPEKIRK